MVGEGYRLRMSGQDVERGTFSQRHLKLVDNRSEAVHCALAEFAEQHQNEIDVWNSPLTENAVLGYEYGYAIESPDSLVLWEAQFGDFYNTAQVVVDTQLTNSEAKWLRQNGLVLVLPHGWDGAGPEHTSCRIERFLMLANSDGGDPGLAHASNSKAYPPQPGTYLEDFRTANFSLCFPTTPANYFHLLRRQVKRPFRKPLVLAGPKTLLRLAECTSPLEALAPGTSFQPVLTYRAGPKNPRRVAITSGKFVYSLAQAVAGDCRVIAVEEVFPFPYEQVREALQGVRGDCQVSWVQEESINSGSYSFVAPRLQKLLTELKVSAPLRYVGRKACPATAVGSSIEHKEEQARLMA